MNCGAQGQTLKVDMCVVFNEEVEVCEVWVLTGAVWSYADRKFS
jgi:hypothetical protein